MNWREVEMVAALRWSRDRTDDGIYMGSHGWPDVSECGISGVAFTDGSVVVGVSVNSTSYSEVTPDINWQPPRFWIGEPTS